MDFALGSAILLIQGLSSAVATIPNCNFRQALEANHSGASSPSPGLKEGPPFDAPTVAQGLRTTDTFDSMQERQRFLGFFPTS
jgi:hypothetical protein